MKWTMTSGAWLGGGPEADVVLSCRARLARNVAGFPFVGHSSDTQRSEVYQIAKRILTTTAADPSMFWVDLRESTRHERELLVERHLISRHHARAKSPRAVAISHDESMSVMVNEEDHFRMQVLAPGLQLQSALDRVNRSEGDASRFISIYEEYRNAPDVTRQRLYLETMQQLLPQLGSKLFLDEDAEGVLPLLPLDTLQQVLPNGNGGGGAGGDHAGPADPRAAA